MRRTRAKKNKKNSKNITKYAISVIVTVLMLIVIVFNGRVSTVLSGTSSNNLTKINVIWSRTNEDVNFIDATDYHKNFWTKSGNNYYFDKTNNKQGTVLTDRLLKEKDKNIVLDYNTLLGEKGILKTTQKTNVWDGKYKNTYFEDYKNNIPNLRNYPDFATWKYKGYIGKYYEHWRAIKGEFEYSKDNISNSKKKVYVGVENVGSELILPVNDYLLVLVDGQVTKMNFSTEFDTTNKLSIKTKDFNNNTILKSIQFTPMYYNRDWKDKDPKYKCNDSNHMKASLHTDTWHAHLSDMVQDGGLRRLGDITEYLNPNIDNHKIELLCGDFSNGGGVSKLQLYCIEEPEIEVKKTGYIINNNKEVKINNDDTEYSASGGDTIYYNFSLTNKSSFDIEDADIKFEDEKLSLVIDSTGVYKDNSKVSTNNLVVNKGILITTGNDALNELKSIKANETVNVYFKEVINHTITSEDVNKKAYINTLKGSIKYFGDLRMEKESTFKVNVKEGNINNISIKKEVQSISRNNKLIYTKGNNEEIPKLNPNDKVKFAITINNNGSSISNLNLSDALSYDSGSYSKNKWVFYKDDNVFDVSNFNMNAYSNITLLTEEWSVTMPKAGEDDEYKITNIAVISKGNDTKESITKMEIERPCIMFKKVVLNKESNVIDTDRTFTIIVSGSNGKKYSFEIPRNTEYTLSNLDYGIKYFINEVCQMNYDIYTTNTITTSNQKNIQIIDNIFNDSNRFFDDEGKTNTFKITAK